MFQGFISYNVPIVRISIILKLLVMFLKSERVTDENKNQKSVNPQKYIKTIGYL